MSDHEFRLFYGLPACAKCGLVQRADRLNRPCPGKPPAVTVRARTTTAKDGGMADE